MIYPELNTHSYIKGDIGCINVIVENVEEYTQVQIEIFNTCTDNNSAKIGFGNTPNLGVENNYSVDMPIDKLTVGIYEIKLIIFHSSNAIEQSGEKITFVSGKDYDRLFFEIRNKGDAPRNKFEIKQRVEDSEKAIEEKFLEPVSINNNIESCNEVFCAFVLIKGVLLGKKTRFKNYEIFPFKRGLDTLDYLNCTNEFVSIDTRINVEFKYTENVINSSRRSNPVAIVHFPTLMATDSEEVVKYCDSKVKAIIKTLSLIRDAQGEIFDIVVVNRKLNSASRHTSILGYSGNLLTGNFAGEDANIFIQYVENINTNPFKKSIVTMYSEAISDKNTEFQYVRFWQIFEVLAESQNYDPNATLTDFDDLPITYDDGGQRKIRGGINIVYNLLKTNSVGDQNNLWNNVNIWYAFRNAVAHHGSIYEYNKLSRKNVKKWAEEGINILNGSQHHDPILWVLKNDVNLIIRKLIII